MKKIMVLLLALVGAGQVAWASRAAILLENPNAWIAFDTNQGSNPVRHHGGVSTLSFDNNGTQTFEPNADFGGQHIVANANQGMWGSAMPFGSGDWTYVLRAKAVTTANYIMFCLGKAGGSGNRGLVLYTGGNDTIKLSVVENFQNYEATCSFTVTGATTDYHDYAVAYSKGETCVRVYVDGVYKTSMAYTNFDVSNTYWQFAALFGGTSSQSTLINGAGVCIDDFRFYQRQLTTDELAALKEGRTQVPVFGGFLGTDDQLLWPGVQLKDIYRFRGIMGGGALTRMNAWRFYQTHTADAAAAQYSEWGNGAHGKVAKAVFTQTSTGVVAKVTYAKYVQPSAGGADGTIGNDFDVNPATASTISMGNEMAGYGVYALTADVLTDGNAAIWSGTDGTLSDTANYENATAVAANGNLSFRSGSGTVQNDFAAGTKFDTLAFGIESGSWNLTGNAATFADVVNASTQAQTIGFPMTYTGNFTPESWGPITFTDLTVGGTFQPIGSGDVRFAGNTSIAKADFRKTIRTVARPSYIGNLGSTWTAGAGYYSSNKIPQLNLTTLSGGTTRFGELIVNRRGQFRYNLVLDGNFTIGGTFYQGCDNYVTVTNGTTVFENPYTPGGSYGVNAYFCIFPGAALTMPRYVSTTPTYFINQGTLTVGDASMSSYNVYVYGAGTTRATRLTGYGVVLDGQTLQPESGSLSISAPVSFAKGNCSVTGVTYRVATPAGTPGAIEQTSTLTLNGIPLTVTGRGRFTYTPTAAFTLPKLTVGADATADFSAAASLTVTDLTLEAGSTLVLPPLALSAKTTFTNPPTLPDEGTATLALEVPNGTTNGVYTVVPSGLTAEQLEHVKVTLTGASAANYTVSTAIDAGALKVTLGSLAAVTGEKTATLVTGGYEGAETLTNFTVCVKLPICVPGFRFTDALADGSDVWFADADGNRLPAEKEYWNATAGEAIFWVKLPSVTRTTTFTMHWGGEAVAASTTSDVWSSNYVGVWHMNETSGNAVNSADANFPAVPSKGTNGDTSKMVGCTGKVGGARINGVSDITAGNYYSVANYDAKGVGNSFTISGWFYANNISGYPRAFSRKVSHADANGWEIHWENNTATKFWIRGINGTSTSIANVTSPVKQWVHYAFVYNNTTVTLYVNGSPLGSLTIDAATDNGKTMSIGCDSNGDERSFNGNLDEIRLHDAVESADWIRAAYETMVNPATFLVCANTSIPYTETLTINTDEQSGTYDVSSITAEKVVVTGADALTLSGTTPANVKVWDFTASTGTVTLNCATDAATVLPGADTVLAKSGTGALLIAAGKKVTVPEWSGALHNAGTIRYTLSSQVDTIPTSGTTEYAATHVLAFNRPTTPIVLSGDITYTHSRGLSEFLNSTVTVVDGAHVTLATGIDFAEENDVKGRGNYGVHLTMNGGVMEGLDSSCSFNYGGYTGTSTRDASITLTGGTFRVPLNFWRTSVVEDNERTTINVGGSTVFAPASLGWRNASTAHSGSMRGYITLRETGRFVIPATIDSLPYLPITVGEGTPMLASPDGGEAYCTAPITIPAERTLTIPDASTMILQSELTGAGTLAVAQGGVLDLTETAFVATNFTGTVRVLSGGVLILPADRVPPYAIALDAGAQVIATVTELPEGTATFLGALASVPSDGTATITFDLPAAVPQGSLYTLSTSTLDATTASHLALTFVGAAGETTSGTIEMNDSGAVVARITDSTAKGALEWKAGRVTSELTELAWTLYGSSDTTAYPFAANVPLYFTDKGSDTSVTFAETVKPSTLTVNAAQDYIFMGSKIDTPTVVKDGTGTLTVNNGFTAPNSVTVKGGVLKIGDSAKLNVLGPAGTAVNVEEGATLDLNQRISSSGNTDRGAALQNAIVTIKGAGTEGQGAITDASGVYTGNWQHSLGRVVLAGDATVGGTSRIDIRKTGSAYDGNSTLTGPTDATLTVKTHIDESYDCGFNLNNTTVKLGKIVLAEGGMMGAEGATTFDLPQGMEMQKNSRFHYWNTTSTKPQIVVTGSGAGLKVGGGASTQDRFVSVAKDASLDMRGSQQLTLKGGLANEGSTTTSSSTFEFNGGSITNNGTMTVQGGTLQLYPSVLTGTGTFKTTSGTLRFGSPSTTARDAAITLAMTGGDTWWYFPTLESSATLDASGITGGTLHFRGQAAKTVPTAFTSANPGVVRVDCDSSSTPISIPAGTYNWSKACLGPGTSDCESYLKLLDGANVTVSTFSPSYGSSSTKASQVEIQTGATLTMTSWVRFAHWPSTARHEVIVNGGTFDHQLATDNTRMGWDGQYGYLTINAGTVKTRGFTCFGAWRDPASWDAQVVMNGGTLELAERGANGNSICAWTHFKPFVVFNGGTVKAMNNWNVEQMRSASFGTQAGGHVDFDLNGKTVDWRTGLQGHADVTLKGAGTFKSGYGSGSKNLLLQGLLTGAWSIENTGANDLSGASGFLGGLHLAENVAATVHIAGSNLCEGVYLQTSATSMNTGYGTSETYPFTCNDLLTMHYYEGETYSKGQFQWQGLFYADTEGTWTFAGSYDDGFYFKIDDTAVINTTSWSTPNLGKITLTKGWHSFWMVQYQNGGNWGCPANGWAKVMNLGFKKGDSSSTTASDYLRFDTHNLLMKPLTPNAAARTTGVANWSSVKGYNSGTVKTRTDLKSNGTYKLSNLNTYNVAATPTFSGSTHQFDGWFFVKPAQAGDWTVVVNYDDAGALWIDGVDTGANGSDNGKTVVTVKGVSAGWHSFKLRVGDNAGNWGPWGNSGTCVKITVNGTTYKLDETYFTISATKPLDYAGLDGTVELDAGSTLTNDATADSCPIWGTLKGSGKLVGKFAFAGDENVYEVTGTGTRATTVHPDMSGVTTTTANAGLRKIKATFEAQPGCARYNIGLALGAVPGQIALEIKDAAGNDYTDAFSVAVEGTNLYLKNAHPRGTIILIK